MYYGYLNYKELTNEKKYVIFVDIGYSKTSFIFSEFTQNEFIVKKVENIPFLGGRDFNDRIFEKCLKQFEKENNKMKKEEEDSKFNCIMNEKQEKLNQLILENKKLKDEKEN